MSSDPRLNNLIDAICRRRHIVEVWSHNIELLEECGLDAETLEHYKRVPFEMPILTKDEAEKVVSLHEEFKKSTEDYKDKWWEGAND